MISFLFVLLIYIIPLLIIAYFGFDRSWKKASTVVIGFLKAIFIYSFIVVFFVFLFSIAVRGV
ncbi:hypothetical protein DX928_02765 [Bacillus swezeyi]|uniref:Uncharacterized protein n=1 Tax=Bacillus swezeyi TaxID=1925020 RepID=A0A5M8RU70_9BACI|nr:hypothetical protein DX927_11080 [Bacillus swezeyi]KAA6482051.1 hypothetical protein DX928_02765 [Bacillus swezeyi]